MRTLTPLTSEEARRRGAMRRIFTKAGGRPPVKRYCINCGVLCNSRKAAKRHCVKPK